MLSHRFPIALFLLGILLCTAFQAMATPPQNMGPASSDATEKKDPPRPKPKPGPRDGGEDD